ncbi:Serine/threonine protein kinase [Enhygromyxa salina]|uniref:Serine/threonine protein kinase n=1 Tax=Enhygromyxa salina TaxID=215803 RepID=A0A0C1ZVH6_9BACT|nr:Serine/threonine protein kinase [Enhygromyxa salina]
MTVTADADQATIVGSGPSSNQPLGVGSQLGAYKLDRRLGAGGMGEVFAARKTKDGPFVALKVLSDIHATRLYRFKREFRALADVKHDNLIALDELVVLPSGQAFFTMELVDGESFVDYVRGDTPAGQLPNLVRLELALGQLIAGVHHLHLARCVHRDLKPSNVLVTREGRVVILDFGVVSELSEVDDGMTREGQMMGTPAYMAPEQAGGQVAGTAADFYALGTMLFECLTGTLPFAGSVIDVLVSKRHGDIPDPAARLDPGVTRSGQVETLLDLCRRALRVEPDERPSSKEFVAYAGRVSASNASQADGRISSIPGGVVPGTAGAAAIEAAPFVGRVAELARLEAAFERVRDSVSPVTVHVRGHSGQGKSTLINQFWTTLRRKGDVVLLRGRCLERESVPYKGVDAVVDALSIYLRRLEAIEAARLQPRHVAPLLQLFPVLGDAWPDGARVMDIDPGELRRRGLAGLREVLARVGERRPLVVHVDDFQWADVDSARLITELMRPPDPPAMLLIISFRDEVDEREALQLLTGTEAVSGRDVRALEIGPLSSDEARELADALMRERDPERPDTGAAEVFARRAQGNPFYIGQMVMGDDAHSSSSDASLDRLVARRIVALEPIQRSILATVAVAAGPTPLAVVLRACGADGWDDDGLVTYPEGDLETRPQSSATAISPARAGLEPAAMALAIAALVHANLLLRHAKDGAREGAEKGGAEKGGPEKGAEADAKRGVTLLEAAHDRIRVVAVGELSPAELRATHLALGEAFEALGGGESEALAEHFAVGGDPDRALDYTERAAADAAAALAFDRAAQLYRRALTLIPGDQHDRRRRLELALAEQLVDLGRGAEAAAMFIGLAPGADSPQASRELERRAASELVKAGYLDEGMDTITPVLRAVGIWHPRGTFMAIVGTLWNRLLLGIRGYAFKQRQQSEVPPQLLERIDTLLATKTGLTHHEAIFTGYQQSRAIRLALRAGEARRLIRCLVHDAAIFVAIGRKQKGRALMDVARELVKGVSEPEYHRVVEYVTANHHDHSGNWLEAASEFEELQERLDESPNSGWIRGASTVQWMYVSKLLGRFGLLRAQLPERVATARDLGNRHEHISLSALLSLVTAIYIDPGTGPQTDAAFAECRQLLAEVREQWHPRQITFQHIIMAMTEVEIAMLAGDPAGAVGTAERVLGDTRARIVAMMMPSHIDFYELRGRSRVRAALEGIDTQRSLELVRHDLKRLRGGHKPQVAAQAIALEAALHSCLGDDAAAQAAWRRAAESFEALAMGAHLASVRTRLGGLGDSAAGELARGYFEAQGITAPMRLVDALAPGRG